MVRRGVNAAWQSWPEAPWQSGGHAAPTPIFLMILFLDFDGVLHPAQAGPNQRFIWVDLLDDLLAKRPHVQVVLSTGWVQRLPFELVRDCLPEQLRRRVVGSTWHRIQHDPKFSHGLQLSHWRDATRYQQIKRWADVQRLRRWLAVDDDVRGWREPGRLVQTDPATGLSDPAVLARLGALL